MTAVFVPPKVGFMIMLHELLQQCYTLHLINRLAFKTFVKRDTML